MIKYHHLTSQQLLTVGVEHQGQEGALFLIIYRFIFKLDFLACYHST